MAKNLPAKPQTVKDKREDIKALLLSKQDEIAKVVPRHLTADRLINIFLLATSRQPALLECTQFSLVNAFLQSVELGLPLGNVTAMAWIIPFRNSKTGKREAQFIPSYRGLADLARRSGEVTNIYAEVVYENDQFDYTTGSFPKIVHKPVIVGERGEPIAVYAVAHIKHAEYPQCVVLTIEDVEKVKASSKAKSSGPWVDWWEEMAKKTAIKRISKTLPLNSDYAYALEIDNAVETGQPLPPSKSTLNLMQNADGSLQPEEEEDWGDRITNELDDTELSGEEQELPLSDENGNFN